MSKEQQSGTPVVEGSDELKKSIDGMLEGMLSEYKEKLEKGKHPANIDIYGDSETTADAALAKVEKSPNDKRNPGRPTQISDVPAKDTDGSRVGEYDGKITEREGVEDESEDTKKQVHSMDQTNDKNRMSGKPKAPPVRPFKKSEENMSPFEKSYSRFNAFQDFETLERGEAIDGANTPNTTLEVVNKSETTPTHVTISVEQYEALKKGSEITSEKDISVQENPEIQGMKDNVELLTKGMAAQNMLLTKMANLPRPQKSITNIETMEKGNGGQPRGVEVFSKAEKADAAVELVTKGQLPMESVAEIEMTGTLYNKTNRAIITNYLETQTQ